MLSNESAPSTAILQTKLHAPSPHPGLVDRPQLLERLSANLLGPSGFTRKVTLIAAPAGYGKTTLASQWLKSLDIPSTWLALEPPDNDPSRFVQYLVAALKRIAPGVGDAALGMLAAPQKPPWEIMLTTILNDLAGHSDAIVLVVDDYHVIQTPPIHVMLQFLVEHLPANSHLVLVSREDPPLPLPRMRARNEILEIRQDGLSFDVGEATSFFQRVSGIDLSSEQARSLTNRTEGWVTGLQLAALSLKSAGDQQAFIDSFAGSNRFVLDYLFEEVFEQQTDEMKSFLLHTAVLNRVCADLADTVTQGTGSQDVLEHLEQTNFFIIPLDDTREWYRYHHLFVDLLRLRLGQVSLQEELLHERASRWYADHGFMEKAIEHALAAKQWDTAGELIQSVCDGYLLRGEISTLLRWYRQLPDTMLQNPEWALSYAWTLILIGNLDPAESILENLYDIVGPSNERLLGEIAAAEAFISRTRGDMSATIKHSRRALDLLPEDDNRSRGNISLNLGLITWHLGQLDEADAAMQEALRDAQATDNHYAMHTALTFLARSHAARGDLSGARRQLELAKKLGDQIPTAVLVHLDLAAIEFDQNNLDGAWGCLERAASISEMIHNLEFQTACAVQRALFHLSFGENRKAEAVLAPSVRLSHSRKLPLLTDSRVKACQIQIELADGDVDAARRVKEAIPVPHDAHTFFRFIDLNTARIHLAAGEKRKAHRHLQQALEKAEACCWTYAKLVIHILLALAEEDQDQALNHLQTALTMAEPEHILRVFLNEPFNLTPLLLEAARRNIAPTHTGNILAAAGVGQVVQPADSNLVEPLSARENEVLSLLAAGFSNRQIAEELVVSLSTVKSHIHHIYGKLDVSNRTQAAARAREMGLL